MKNKFFVFSFFGWEGICLRETEKPIARDGVFVVQFTYAQKRRKAVLFEKWLLPDIVLPGYQSLTPEMLLSLGKKGLICDIDNTLATYDDADPPEAVRDWCRRMQESGISVAFVSILSFIS